jgi:hypothetical protein
LALIANCVAGIGSFASNLLVRFEVKGSDWRFARAVTEADIHAIRPAIGFDPKRISAFSVPEARLQLSPEWYKTLAGGALTLQARLTTLGPPDRAMA